MTDRYSIQRFDTKKAALDALEDPAARPPEPEQPVGVAAAPPAVNFAQSAIRAEIARQVALALQQHLAAGQPSAPDTAAKMRLIMFPGGAQ